MKSECADFAELVSAHADGELSGADLERVGRHLVTCPDCQAFADACRDVDRAVAGLAAPEVGGRRWAAMRAGLCAAGRGSAARRAHFRLAAALMLTAAAASVLAVLSIWPARPPRGRDYLPARRVQLERTDRRCEAAVLVPPDGGLVMVVIADQGGDGAGSAGGGGREAPDRGGYR